MLKLFSKTGCCSQVYKLPIIVCVLISFSLLMASCDENPTTPDEQTPTPDTKLYIDTSAATPANYTIQEGQVPTGEDATAVDLYKSVDTSDYWYKSSVTSTSTTPVTGYAEVELNTYYIVGQIAYSLPEIDEEDDSATLPTDAESTEWSFYETGYSLPVYTPTGMSTYTCLASLYYSSEYHGIVYTAGGGGIYVSIEVYNGNTLFDKKENFFIQNRTNPGGLYAFSDDYDYVSTDNWTVVFTVWDDKDVVAKWVVNASQPNKIKSD